MTDGVKAYEDAVGSLPGFPAGGPEPLHAGRAGLAACAPAARRLQGGRSTANPTTTRPGSSASSPRAGGRLRIGVAQRAARGGPVRRRAARLVLVRARLGGALGAGRPAQVDSREWDFIPNHVTLHGQPNATWWELEDAQTDFGSTDLEKVDLAKLLVMQFALLYGNDWFERPLPLELGSLASVTLLVVTDTFGQRTLIRPTGAGGPGSRGRCSAPGRSRRSATS